MRPAAQGPPAQEPPAQGPAAEESAAEAEESAAEGHPAQETAAEESAAEAEESAAAEPPAQESAAQGPALQRPGMQSPAAQRQPPRACVPNTERVTGRGRVRGGGKSFCKDVSAAEQRLPMGPSPTILGGEAGATRRARGLAGPCALRCRRKPRSRTPPPFGKATRAGAPGGFAAGRGIVSHIAGNAASAVWLKNG
eukprot:scaffold14530_cov69-Phaeocystis_antarctica.AAC.3